MKVNPKAIEEASNNEDEMSSLSSTPGMSPNRTPPQPNMGATECPARKALFRNTAPSINEIDSNKASCPIGSTATENVPSSDVPLFFKEAIRTLLRLYSSKDMIVMG